MIKLNSYGFKVTHLKNDGEFLQLVFSDNPELIYTPLISLPTELSDLYALEIEKKKKNLQTNKMLNVIQLMDDEGLGHCKRMVNFSQKLQSEGSDILLLVNRVQKRSN